MSVRLTDLNCFVEELEQFKVSMNFLKIMRKIRLRFSVKKLQQFKVSTMF